MNLLPSGGAKTASPLLLAESRPAGKARAEAEPRILACVNDSDSGHAVVMHALALAQGLDLKLTLARVLETPVHRDAPADPVEWELRRNECRRSLERIAADGHGSSCGIESVVLAGPTADELVRWADDHRVTLIVLATHDSRQAANEVLGSTAHAVLHHAASSVLLVPPRDVTGHPGAYRRLLVPLDGSPRAESVLPVAIRIARAQGAEILLAHAVPKIEIVADRLADGEARALLARLNDQNERRARLYLGGLRERIASEPLPVRTMVVSNGDPRALMKRLVCDERIDMIIVSSHGRSGMTDVPVGSVTEYLANHAPVPVLILRPNFAHVFARQAEPDRMVAPRATEPSY